MTKQELSALDEIAERGSVRVPVVWWKPPEFGDPPEFYIDPISGEPTGVVPELARVLARDLGVELTLVEVPWHEHMAALMEHRVDLLLSFTNTPQRALQIDFAGRLLPDAASALVRSESAARTLHDLDRQGTRVAVPRGSSVIDIATRHLPNATIVESDDPIGDLEAGTADAMVDCAITHPMLNMHPTLTPIRDEQGEVISLGMEYGHPAVRQGDRRLLLWLNNWLEYHRALGTIDRWVGDYWTRWMIV